MLTKTHRFIAKHWPLICGLIIGGLLGGITQSFSVFLLFGAIGWAYFHFDFFYIQAGTPCAESCQEEDDGLRNAMYRQSEEESMAAAGLEPYATIYGYPQRD